MDDDTFQDATDNTTAAVCDDGEYVNLTVEVGEQATTIALTPEDARRMARVLNMYAAGL